MPFAPSQRRGTRKQMAFGQSGRLSHISTPAVHDITSDPYHRLETPKGRWTRSPHLQMRTRRYRGQGVVTAGPGKQADCHMRSHHCALWRKVPSPEVADPGLREASALQEGSSLANRQAREK